MPRNSSSQEPSIELLLEEYKLYVEMMDRMTARRIETSKIYTSLLSALLAVVPFVIGQKIETQKIIFLLLGFLGLSLCVTWAINIRSYKQINSLKFKVIHEMEKKLPFNCYTREWEILKTDKSHSYFRLSKIEQLVPFLMLLPYIALLTFVFVK